MVTRGAFGDVGGGTKPIDQLLAQQQVQILPDALEKWNQDTPTEKWKVTGNGTEIV